MKYEKSCGAVVYDLQNDTPIVLVEYMKKGHVSIPKGHVEEGETEVETAAREILEETGLPSVIFDGDQTDPDIFSEAQFETRIQSLLEIMEKNKYGK